MPTPTSSGWPLVHRFSPLLVLLTAVGCDREPAEASLGRVTTVAAQEKNPDGKPSYTGAQLAAS